MLPPVGASCSRISFEVVVLPQPDFADQTQGFARIDRKIDPVHRLDPAGLGSQQSADFDREVFLHILEFKQWR